VAPAEAGKTVGARESVLRRALDSPRGQKVPNAVRQAALGSLWELAAWHAADQPWQAIKWYLKAAGYRPFSLSAYKGVLRTVLRRQ